MHQDNKKEKIMQEHTQQMIDLAQKITQETRDAYSFARYGTEEWHRICVHLLNVEGFSEAQTKEYLYSKAMRHAADSKGKATLEEVLRYEGMFGLQRIKKNMPISIEEFVYPYVEAGKIFADKELTVTKKNGDLDYIVAILPAYCSNAGVQYCILNSEGERMWNYKGDSRVHHFYDIHTITNSKGIILAQRPAETSAGK